MNPNHASRSLMRITASAAYVVALVLQCLAFLCQRSIAQKSSSDIHA